MGVDHTLVLTRRKRLARLRWSGFAAMFLSIFVLFAAQMMNRPFRDGEFLAVVLIELAVFTISAVCIFIPAWFPASNDVDDAE